MIVGVLGVKIGVENNMEIAICDDDKVFRQSIKKILIDYRNENRFEINIYEFDTGDSFLQSEHIFDVVFLDYQMPGLDGLQTARQLRDKNILCSIVFTTNYPEFVLESFAVQPLRFIVKPVDKQKVLEAMAAYVKMQKLYYPISIIEDGEMKTIATQDIIYLSGAGKYCKIHTDEHEYGCSKTLTRAHKLLPPHCFYRVHKSYVINMLYVVSLKGNLLTLKTGKCITVGRTYFADFKRDYPIFLKSRSVRI